MENFRIDLPADRMPRKWYNALADMGQMMKPPLNPATGQPIDPSALSAIFPQSLIEQEMTGERWIDIPEPVLDRYMLWRPTPLVRALRLEKHLGTPARIYYKNESVSPAGSHKPNTAVAQAYYNKQAGVKRLSTETGAGQWGSALCYSCAMFGLECLVYMVRVSYEQKPYRKMMMATWGGKVIPSPSDSTNAGRAILAKDPTCSGSLGMAISEAVEVAAGDKSTNYSLGSVLNHVMLHQSIVGLETKEQLKMAGEKPDVLIGCIGGGSNFAGFSFPFLPEKLNGQKIKILAVEPTACPSVTRGKYAYDFGDTAEMTPLLLMYTLGHAFVPPPIHAGGLRYHGMAPMVSALVNNGVIEATARAQKPCFEAAITFARTEGLIPAPETSHAVRVAIDEALECKKTGEKKVIVFNFSGHGLLDLSAYDNYFAGKLLDIECTPEMISKGLAELPKVG